MRFFEGFPQSSSPKRSSSKRMTRRRRKPAASATAAHTPTADSDAATVASQLRGMDVGGSVPHWQPQLGNPSLAAGLPRSTGVPLSAATVPGGAGPSASALSQPSSAASLATSPPPVESSAEVILRTCEHCTVVIAGKVFRCSHCHLVFYCGRDCQASGFHEYDSFLNVAWHGLAASGKVR